jgi:hypothetical protein
MQRKITLSILLCGSLIASLPFSSLANREPTRMEVFIAREQEQHVFQPVSLWRHDHSVPADFAAAHVRSAAYLTVDAAAALAFMDKKNHAITLHVPGEGKDYQIALARYDYFADGFKVQTFDGNEVKDFDYKPGLHYSGVVDGVPGSIAAFSFFGETIYGIFSIPGKGNYVLAPNTMQGAPAGSYIVYNDADLDWTKAPECRTDELPAVSEDRPLTDIVSRNAYVTCRDLTIYYQAAYATYVSFGSNVTAVTDYITFMQNVSATLYRNEGLYTSIKVIQVNTSTDQYNSLPTNNSLAYLTKFGEVTQNNLNGANVAVLLSTRGGGMGGGMGGVAWLNALCSNYNPGNKSGSYAFANITKSTTANFPTYSWDASMVTHEIGHLIGSPHTHSCSWPGGAIDGCAPVEPTNGCVRPGMPVGGGTIMSYCHNQSVGTNFSNGFGPMPGELIRNKMRSEKACVAAYQVNRVLTTPSTTLTANRECTDPSGVTYYFNDNNNSLKADDIVMLKIRKNNNDIGDMDNGLFKVQVITESGLGSGRALPIHIPAGAPWRTDAAFAVQRYFTFRPVKQPNSNMEFMVPVHYIDSMDLAGSVQRKFEWDDLAVYTFGSTALNPSPANGLNGIGLSDLQIFGYGSAPTTETWALSQAPADSVAYLSFSASHVTGGSVYVNKPFPASVANTEQTASLQAYPNPAREQWTITLPAALGSDPLMFTLYSADGRVALRHQLPGGGEHTISATALPAGMYFYRINGSTKVYTGMLEKQ